MIILIQVDDAGGFPKENYFDGKAVINFLTESLEKGLSGAHLSLQRRIAKHVFKYDRTEVMQSNFTARRIVSYMVNQNFSIDLYYMEKFVSDSFDITGIGMVLVTTYVYELHVDDDDFIQYLLQE